jgi:hypothetical protein
VENIFRVVEHRSEIIHRCWIDIVRIDALPGWNPDSAESFAMPAPDWLDAGQSDHPAESLAFCDSQIQVQPFFINNPTDCVDKD